MLVITFSEFSAICIMILCILVAASVVFLHAIYPIAKEILRDIQVEINYYRKLKNCVCGR